MPYVDIPGTDDYACIYYTTNTIYSNVGGFDPEKPTVIILHPVFLCTRWLQNHFGDQRLADNYNLIAFDNRVSGRSHSKPTGRYDPWVDAADLAYCIQVRDFCPFRLSNVF